MLCNEKVRYIFFLIICLIISPMNLHASWSWPFPEGTTDKPAQPVTGSKETATNPVILPAVPTPTPPVVDSSPKTQVSLPAGGAKPVSATVSPVPAIPLRSPVTLRPDATFSAEVLTEDTVLSGMVQIDGMVTVAPQATLTIVPGTMLRFGSDAGLLVLGRIVAKGTPNAPVILSSIYSEPLPADWYGIVLTGSGKKNSFEFVRIEGADIAVFSRSSQLEMKSVRVMKSVITCKLLDSQAIIKDTMLSDASVGLVAVKGEIELESVSVEKTKTGLSLLSSSLIADKLKITASTEAALVVDKSQLKLSDIFISGNLAGMKISGSDGSITGSRIVANSETGVVLAGSTVRFGANLLTGNRIGLQLDDNLSIVWGNSLYGNSSYNLLYLGDEKLYAGGNWFGRAKAELIDKSLFSRRPGALMIQPLLVSDPLSARDTSY